MLKVAKPASPELIYRPFVTVATTTDGGVLSIIRFL